MTDLIIRWSGLRVPATGDLYRLESYNPGKVTHAGQVGKGWGIKPNESLIEQLKGKAQSQQDCLVLEDFATVLPYGNSMRRPRNYTTTCFGLSESSQVTRMSGSGETTSGHWQEDGSTRHQYQDEYVSGMCESCMKRETGTGYNKWDAIAYTFYMSVNEGGQDQEEWRPQQEKKKKRW